jgi:hypothetical protein
MTAGAIIVTTPTLSLFTVALLGCCAMAPMRAQAQWWTSSPADFEDCAERAGQSAASTVAKGELLGECEAGFAGRRKPGGGYTYYDFMQIRSFDIAGPNPTTAEQRAIDEAYMLYLDHQRRNVILAAFTRTQREQPLAALGPLDKAAITPTSTPARTIRSGSVITPRPRPKTADCGEPLACGWSRLTAGVKDLKKALFGPSVKTTRS